MREIKILRSTCSGWYSTNKVELLRMSAIYDFRLPRACYPGLPLDTAEWDDDALTCCRKEACDS